MDVATDEEVRRFIDSGEIRSRGFLHLGIDERADPDEDCIEAFLEQVVDRLVFSDVRIGHKPDSGALELLPGLEPDLFGQLEVRDAVHKQATRSRF